MYEVSDLHSYAARQVVSQRSVLPDRYVQTRTGQSAYLLDCLSGIVAVGKSTNSPDYFVGRLEECFRG
jgi:hypothetical protein